VETWKERKRKVDGWVTVRKIQKLRRELKTKWNFEKQKVQKGQARGRGRERAWDQELGTWNKEREGRRLATEKDRLYPDRERQKYLIRWTGSWNSELGTTS
jgi:hypothetical protein